MASRQPARRTTDNGDEVVEIRVIARDNLVRALAEQIVASIPNCPPPRFSPSRKDAGRTLAYIKFKAPTQRGREIGRS
ncbi:hypothetical protein [Streptomyces sp. NPDC088261]|uniref:hypothetical protein n=1 Tax=Streptomyces sp. NPDC088261 TaxID=3365851 RepID=UPI00380FD03F